MQNLNTINDLNKYMFNLKNIGKIEIINSDNKMRSNKLKPNKLRTNNNNKVMSTITNPVNNIFFPKQKDNLFWCFYIILNSLSTYEMISNFFTTEKETKYKLVEELRTKKELFKPIKISRNTVENELGNLKTISIKTIKALCHLKDINIFYIDNQKYYEIIINENKPIYVIEKINNLYGLKQNITTEKIDYYRDNYWKLENLDKPIKAISSYKSIELKDICKRLNIECMNMTKPQMYEKILEKLHN